MQVPHFCLARSASTRPSAKSSCLRSGSSWQRPVRRCEICDCLVFAGTSAAWWNMTLQALLNQCWGLLGYNAVRTLSAGRNLNQSRIAFGRRQFLQQPRLLLTILPVLLRRLVCSGRRCSVFPAFGFSGYANFCDKPDVQNAALACQVCTLNQNICASHNRCQGV